MNDLMAWNVDATRLPAKMHGQYLRRWNLEVDLRNLKTTLGMHELRGPTPQMALKASWVYLLTYNLIRLPMAQGPCSAARSPPVELQAGRAAVAGLVSRRRRP